MSGLLRGIARTAAVAGTATAVSNRVSRRQAGRWAEQDTRAYGQQAEATPAPPPAPTQPPPSDDMSSRIAQLKELAVLKEQGILTEAEFAEQKSRILNS
ncbi:SHOCT domain-containing protein [Streptomyces sp. NPDC060028]|uniref:SHOCT domain-containing protein n=1 Tax=Streptomyces sp. NPDC060028 TaxID=3347041 RepID=UPI0036CF4FA5